MHILREFPPHQLRAQRPKHLSRGRIGIRNLTSARRNIKHTLARAAHQDTQPGVILALRLIVFLKRDLRRHQLLLHLSNRPQVLAQHQHSAIRADAVKAVADREFLLLFGRAVVQLNRAHHLTLLRQKGGKPLLKLGHGFHRQMRIQRLTLPAGEIVLQFGVWIAQHTQNGARAGNHQGQIRNPGNDLCDNVRLDHRDQPTGPGHFTLRHHAPASCSASSGASIGAT